MKQSLLLISFICILEFPYAQPGAPDTSFGINGLITTNFDRNIRYDNKGSQVLVQSDGSMYIIFDADEHTVIAKRFSNGALDFSYGQAGFAFSRTISNGRAALQPDGKLVLAGSVITLHPEDYDNDGYTSDFGVTRFNSNGNLDNTFGKDGTVTTDFIGVSTATINHDIPRAIAIQNNGKIVVAGSTTDDFYNDDFALARYNADGSTDSTFAGDGKQTYSLSFSDDFAGLAVRSDGKIMIAGTSTIYTDTSESSDIILLCYNNDGNLDNTFSDNGVLNIDFGFYDGAGSVAIQGDGKIVVSGVIEIEENSYYNFFIARYNINGAPDKSFSDDGFDIRDMGVNYTSYAISIENDGKIVVGGSKNGSQTNNSFRLVRYYTNGNFDSTFGVNGTFTTDKNIASLALQTDGKIVLAGSIVSGTFKDYTLSRYNANGSLDNTFDNDGTLQDHYTVGKTLYSNSAIQGDGKIIAVGSSWNGADFDFALARYNTDGTLDNSFDGDGKKITDVGFNENATSAAIQSDGKIVIAGNSANGNILSYFLLRYNTDGSLDNTFDGDGKLPVNFAISLVKLQNDGKILAGGEKALARYNSNGAPDITFNNTGKIISAAKDFALQNDGKIVLLDERFSVLRYNSNGILDPGFVSETPYFFPDYEPGDYDHPISGSGSIATQDDGNIVVGGYAGINYRYSETTDIALARFKPDGQLDHTFSEDGLKIVEFKTYSSNCSFALQSDGKIVVKGSLFKNVFREGQPDEMVNEGFGLARVNADGSIDYNFGTLGMTYAIPENDIQNIAVHNEKLYAVGYRTDIGSSGFLARYLLEGSNQIPPTIALASAGGGVYLTGGNVYITATAIDLDGVINKVEFYNGSTLVYTVTDTPYTFTWLKVNTGNYTFTAKATDNSGLTTTSDSLHISVVPNEAPAVAIINPLNGETFLKGATIHLQASAQDLYGRITKVEFYHGTTLLATERKLPYTYDFNAGQLGDHTFTAKATDNWGAETTSAIITVYVVPNKAPSVSITSPANGENFTAPATITLAASAQDPDGRITKVEFYNGTALLAIERKLPHTYQWQNVPAGVYTITAVARDNWGETTTSAPVIVTVTANGIVSSKPSSLNNKANPQSSIRLQLTPNPARNIVKIYTTGLQKDKQTSLSIISASGVTMKTIKIVGYSQTIPLDVSSLASGVYSIKIINGDKVLYRKLVKI